MQNENDSLMLLGCWLFFQMADSCFKVSLSLSLSVWVGMLNKFSTAYILSNYGMFFHKVTLTMQMWQLFLAASVQASPCSSLLLKISL